MLRKTDETDSEFLNALERQNDVDRFIGGLRKRMPDSHYFTILEGDVRVGHVALISQAPDSNEYALVCAVSEEARGRRIATEACAEVIKWAFEELGVPRVVGCLDQDNTSSLALVDRLGMRELEQGDGSAKRCFELAREGWRDVDEALDDSTDA